jgi:hypothetical protein
LRTCARSCHWAGGELEQIQFLLGHASVQTTGRYLGCQQKLSQAVNDDIGLEDTEGVVTAHKTSGASTGFHAMTKEKPRYKASWNLPEFRAGSELARLDN